MLTARDYIIILLIGFTINLLRLGADKESQSKEYTLPVCMQSQVIEGVDVCTLYDFNGELVATASGIIFTKE